LESSLENSKAGLQYELSGLVPFLFGWTWWHCVWVGHLFSKYKRPRFPYFADIFLYFLLSLISSQIIKVQGHLVLTIMCGTLTRPDGPPKRPGQMDLRKVHLFLCLRSSLLVHLYTINCIYLQKDMVFSFHSRCWYTKVRLLNVWLLIS